MLNCMIVDDEKSILNELIDLLSTLEVEVIGSYTNPIKALDEVIDLDVDVAFLDIELPGINGIELAKRMQDIHPNLHIVFLTAYEHYSLEAFGVGAIHYLLKPTSTKELETAINRVNHFKTIAAHNTSVDTAALVPSKIGTSDRISLVENDDIIVLLLEDILYFTSTNGVTTIFSKDRSFTSRKTLNYWEKILKHSDFIRCHKSYIVNANYIFKLRHVLGDQKEIQLSYCDIRIPTSRRKVKDIKNWLGLV